MEAQHLKSLSDQKDRIAKKRSGQVSSGDAVVIALCQVIELMQKQNSLIQKLIKQ